MKAEKKEPDIYIAILEYLSVVKLRSVWEFIQSCNFPQNDSESLHWDMILHKDFFSKYDQIHSFLRILSYLLKKFLCNHVSIKFHYCFVENSVQLIYYVQWVKNVQIRGFFWSIFSCIRTEYKKYGPEKTTYLDFSCSGTNTHNYVFLKHFTHWTLGLVYLELLDEDNTNNCVTPLVHSR